MSSEQTVYEVRFGYNSPRKGLYTGSPIGVVEDYDGPESFRALAWGIAHELGQVVTDDGPFGVKLSGNGHKTRYVFYRAKTVETIGKDMKDRRGVKNSMDFIVDRFRANPEPQVEALPTPVTCDLLTCVAPDESAPAPTTETPAAE
jgi:hypothetical protein